MIYRTEAEVVLALKCRASQSAIPGLNIIKCGRFVLPVFSNL